jgi:hypothetical protein
VAVLVLVLGTDPGDGRFLSAFLLAAAIALVGIVWSWAGFRAPAAQAGPPKPSAVGEPVAASEEGRAG